MLIKHVVSDATDDRVQELAPMEAAPTAGDFLERVINEDYLGDMGGLVAEDAMKDVPRGCPEARQARIAPTQDSFQGTSGTRGSS